MAALRVPRHAPEAAHLTPMLARMTTTGYGCSRPHERRPGRSAVSGQARIVFGTDATYKTLPLTPCINLSCFIGQCLVQQLLTTHGGYRPCQRLGLPRIAAASG
jgi:hypothetical protein